MGREGDWTQVQFKDPQLGLRTGWVEAKLLKVEQPSLEPMDLSMPGPGPVASSEASQPKPLPVTPAEPVRTALGAVNAKPRVFVTDSQSWQMSGGFAGNNNGVFGAQSGGARPQTAEIVKTLGERCDTVTVTSNKERADYVLVIDKEGGKGLVLKDTKFALFNRDGDAVKSGSTRSIGNAVKDVCAALMRDAGR